MSDLINTTLDLRQFNKEMGAYRAGMKDWTWAATWFFQRWKVIVLTAWAKVRRGGGTFRGMTWTALKKDTRPKMLNAIINMRTGALKSSILDGRPVIKDKNKLQIGTALPEYGLYAMAIGGRNPLQFVLPEDENLAIESARQHIDRIKAQVGGR